MKTTPRPGSSASPRARGDEAIPTTRQQRVTAGSRRRDDPAVPGDADSGRVVEDFRQFGARLDELLERQSG